MESRLRNRPDIGTDFRVRVTRYIVERWRSRLRGFRPYHRTGYILFMYETVAPKLDVNANLPYGKSLIGLPYERRVQTLEEYWRPYGEGKVRDWINAIQGRCAYRGPSRRQLLEMIEIEGGSIGAPTASRLGMNVAQLRREIEDWEIGEKVNAIRKRHGRRPAKFVADALDYARGKNRIWYEIWPKDY